MRVICFSLTAMLALTASPATPAAEPNHKTAGIEKIRPEVLAHFAAGEGESAALVVVLEGAAPPVFSAGAKNGGKSAAAPSLVARKAEIATLTDRLLSRLQAAQVAQVSSVRRFEVLPLLALSARWSAVAALAAAPEVAAIALDQRRFLARLEGGAVIQQPALTALGFTGAGQTIAVIDNGVDYFHPELGLFIFPNSKVIGGFDFVNNDADPAPDIGEPSQMSHGTSVAGIIAGSSAGMARAAKIVALKSCDSLGCPDSRVAAAIDWSVAHKAEFGITIINMSLQGGQYMNRCDQQEPVYATAINAAVAAGLHVFAAAGNSGYLNALAAPACITAVASVGAAYDADIGAKTSCLDDFCTTSCTDFVTAADQVTCYSNSAGFLSIYAPANCASTARVQGGTAECFGGTSAASGYASGGAALLLEAIGPRSPTDLRSLMRNTGIPLIDAKSGRSAPRLDLLKVYQSINGGGSCTTFTQNISYVPAVANTPGVPPAYFVSDLHVFNPSFTLPITVSVTLLATDAENLTPACKDISVAPRQEVAYKNIVGLFLGATGSGALRLAASGPYLATSKTYDNSGPGTYGQSIPVVPAAQAITRGVIMNLTNTTDFRSNAGIVNPNSVPAQAFLNLYDGEGLLLVTGSVTVKANSHFQASTIFGYLGIPTRIAERAYLEFTSDQPVIAYGSILDNTTDDPIAVLAQ